jgi:hypothetical protein
MDRSAARLLGLGRPVGRVRGAGAGKLGEVAGLQLPAERRSGGSRRFGARGGGGSARRLHRVASVRPPPAARGGVDRRGGVDEVAQLRGGGGSWPARRAHGA